MFGGLFDLLLLRVKAFVVLAFPSYSALLRRKAWFCVKCVIGQDIVSALTELFLLLRVNLFNFWFCIVQLRFSFSWDQKFGALNLCRAIVNKYVGICKDINID